MSWQEEPRGILLALQFLTRLPVPGTVAFSDAAQHESMRWHPLVGLLIGGIGAVVLLLSALVLPVSLAVLGAVAATLLATGAMHEDGLADCADGLGGGMTRARSLEIMRDSRVGVFGLLAVGMVLALKVAALSALPVWLAACLLGAAHGLSRFVPVLIVARHGYARETGAKFAAPQVAPETLRIAAVTTVCIAVLLLALTSPGVALGAVAGGALGAWLLTRVYLRRLGGYTGDCLGASQQVAECGVYIGALAWAA